jgi:hypothetical protein
MKLTMVETVTIVALALRGCFPSNSRDEKDEGASSQLTTGLLSAWFTSKVPPPRISTTMRPRLERAWHRLRLL